MSEQWVELGYRPEPSAARLVGTLGVAGLLSGLAIVGAHTVTLPIIEANNARALERAVFTVVPGSERMQGLVVSDGAVRVAGEGETAEVYAAYDGAGVFVGYAIPGQGPGFQDTIGLIYGFDPETRRVVGMEVLESRETPGLGDKIYKDEEFVANFSALAVDPGIVCVKGAEGRGENEVDAITGATISSKAVVSILNETNDRWVELLPAGPGVPAAPIPEETPGGGEGGDDGTD